ncbi:uncharacterized protein FIBRA_05930 [Fibroporia radiculosa]|uniref:Uncharacterized protein n=1 Tax=Fibroporia radiculosa TaxID=599839 RepID=J4GAD1_9APHY|nr:uncharacterized protein FIBRA_05930 [Fibroporia radiculosa]CCM03783.1 predicted protein [Fibroporia radiculosa]
MVPPVSESAAPRPGATHSLLSSPLLSPLLLVPAAAVVVAFTPTPTQPSARLAPRLASHHSHARIPSTFAVPPPPCAPPPPAAPAAPAPSLPPLPGQRRAHFTCLARTAPIDRPYPSHHHLAKPAKASLPCASHQPLFPPHLLCSPSQRYPFPGSCPHPRQIGQAEPHLATPHGPESNPASAALFSFPLPAVRVSISLFVLSFPLLPQLTLAIFPAPSYCSDQYSICTRSLRRALRCSSIFCQSAQ